MRDTFIFYRSFYEAIKELPRDIQGEVYTAIMEYSLNGITTENLKPLSKAVFTLMKPVLDKNQIRYQNGSKGGRPKEEMETKNNQTETKPKPNTNRNQTKHEPYKDKDVDKDLHKDKDVDSEKGAHEIFESIKFEIKNSERWKQDNARIYQKSIEFINSKIDEFLNQIWLKEDFYKGVQELKKHFVSWLILEISKEKSSAKKESIKEITW